MGANVAYDHSESETREAGDGSTNDLYAAIQNMRAHSVRMRALAENVNRDYTQREFVAAERSYERGYERDYARDYRQTGAANFDSGPSYDQPPQVSRDIPPPEPAAPAEPAFNIGRAHIDAASQHLDRGRLPDLNALAELMMEMKGAQRAYELNLQVMDATHAVMARTVDLLRR